MVGYFAKRLKAFGHAFNGIGLLFKDGAHARIHLLAVLVVSFLAYKLNASSADWIHLILCYALVIGLEALNSAIEYIVDLASPEYHELAKKAKDVAAAAVLVAAIGSIIIALIIFLPYWPF